MFGGVNMERVSAPKKSIINNLMDNYQVVRSRPNFRVYPQMPIHQIQLYIKQAARKEYQVVIQMNPSTLAKEFVEVSGKISLSTRSSHIILRTDSGDTVHLIQPHLIRHIRAI